MAVKSPCRRPNRLTTTTSLPVRKPRRTTKLRPYPLPRLNIESTIMKITLYTAKGGAGKTPIATNIFLDRQYAIGTNERFHVFESMEVVDDDAFMCIDYEEEFPEIPDDIDIVFDLAGSISKSSGSIISAINQSDLVIVPIEDELKSINSGINTLLELESVKASVLVVATKLKKGRKEVFTNDWTESASFKNIKNAIVDKCSTDITVLPLKYSELFNTIFDRELSIAQLRNNDALIKHSAKVLDQQFNEIYKYIDKKDASNDTNSTATTATEKEKLAEVS